MRAGGVVGLHGGGPERGVTARGPARRAAQGGLRRLVVRAPCRYVVTTLIYIGGQRRDALLILMIHRGLRLKLIITKALNITSWSRRRLGAGGVPGPAQDVAVIEPLARPLARPLSAAPSAGLYSAALY